MACLRLTRGTSLDLGVLERVVTWSIVSIVVCTEIGVVTPYL